MKSKVGLFSCNTYDPLLIQETLEEAFAKNPEWLKDFNGKKVYLKLNLLMKKKPEDAVTTNPAVVEAVVRILQNLKAEVTIGDSPGGPYIPASLKSIYRVCGIEKVAESTGANLNYDVSEEKVAFMAGKVVKSFVLTSPVMAADKVISISKLKTHMMAKYTGAVKNLFGTIPGLNKVGYHLRMPNVDDFCDMLVDLALCVYPSLNIMDAITAMEGDGPSAGQPRQVGALLVSADPFALDVAALSLVKIEPGTVPTVARAKIRGLAARLEDIEIVGDTLGDLQIEGFKTPKIKGHVRFPIPDILERAIRPRPVFIRSKCLGCGDCAVNCPPGAIKLEQGFPNVDLTACIRCFCCHELCPHNAIEIKRSLFARRNR